MTIIEIIDKTVLYLDLANRAARLSCVYDYHSRRYDRCLCIQYYFLGKASAYLDFYKCVGATA